MPGSITKPEGYPLGAEPYTSFCVSKGHRALAGALFASLSLLAGCGWIEWKQMPVRYYAVERGRLLELVEIHVRVTGNPWNPWIKQLVEECPEGARAAPDGRPCWPRHRWAISQSLLRRIHNELDRSVSALVKGASYLNRDIGAFHPAWIVGTRPLAVAFRQGTADPHPYDDLAQRGIATRPTTTPGVIELVSRSGEVALYDRRARHAKFVTDADMESEVDVVIVFPIEMDPREGHFPPSIPVERSPPARVFYLPQPVTLRSLMHTLTEPQGLERQAARIVEAPVVGPQGRPAM